MQKIVKWIKNQLDNIKELSEYPNTTYLHQYYISKKRTLEDTLEFINSTYPIFKVGDTIVDRNHQEEPFVITEIKDNHYYSIDLDICSFEDQNKWELVNNMEEDNLENAAIHAWDNHVKLDMMDPDEVIDFAKEIATWQRNHIKWLYRLEYKDDTCGLWYNGSGNWCFENGIGSISGCKTKNLPMEYDWRYKQDGKSWFSSCSKKEDLLHWYSLEDAKQLISSGFVFTQYLATEYHEYEFETVFIKETSLIREEIDIFELFK